MPWFCNRLSITEETIPIYFGVYAFYDGVSEEEIARLRSVIEKYPEDAGKVGYSGEHQNENKNVRISCVRWLNTKDVDLAWFLERLQVMVHEANTNMRWNFALDGFYEHLQYARYESETGGYFDDHCDIGRNSSQVSRKLSISVQLTDPADYEGGALELYGFGPAPKQKGTVIIFPSFLMHRVTPVTKGIRESLIVWVSGPPFR